MIFACKGNTENGIVGVFCNQFYLQELQKSVPNLSVSILGFLVLISRISSLAIDILLISMEM